jgi:hypothetical protein
MAGSLDSNSPAMAGRDPTIFARSIGSIGAGSAWVDGTVKPGHNEEDAAHRALTIDVAMTLQLFTDGQDIR